MSDYNDGLGVPDIAPLDNTDPADSEDASQLASSIRQMKSILVALWRVAHEDTGEFKAGATGEVAIGDGTVTGSVDNSTTSVVGKIKQGTVSAADLRDLAVLTTKLAELAVTTSKIADANVTTAKLADACVTASKIANLAIVTAGLADASVTGAKVANATITSANIALGTIINSLIADNTIGADKLAITGTAGQLLMAYGTSPKWRPITLSGAISVDSGGVVTLLTALSVKYASIREQAGKGTDGGGGTATVDLTALATTGMRGSTVPWNISGSLTTVTAVADGTLTFAEAGTYVLFVRSPGYRVDEHKIALQVLNSAASSILGTVYGSSEKAAAGDTTTTNSWLVATVALSAGQKIRVRHFTTTQTGTGDFGLHTNATGTTQEVFASIDVLKL